MTRRPAGGEPSNDDELKEALAVLISCTRSRRRPLPLTEIVNWLDIAVSKLGSYSAVGERIGLSGKMLRQFAAVKELTPSVQDLFAERRLDSVDAAVHLAMLSRHDQEVVAKALASQIIRTIDVRAIIQLRQLEKSEPIDSLIRRTVDSKTKQEFIAEFVVRGGRSRGDLIRAFEAYIPSQDIVRLELQGALGRLVLTDAGKRSLAKAAEALGVSMQRVIPAIIEKNSIRS
jgi:hypothetical protein